MSTVEILVGWPGWSGSVTTGSCSRVWRTRSLSRSKARNHHTLTMWSATRSALATIVKVGLTAPIEGMKLPSMT